MQSSASLTLTTQLPPTTTSNKKDAHPIVPPGRSGRLKYADPRDLPSFPSTGLRKDHAAASAAASLGWANQKSIEPWKPDDNTASASAAASLGWASQKSIEPWKPDDNTASASAAAALFASRDSKMVPAWEPERSAAGSKAAVLAAGSAQRHHAQQSSSPSTWGSSAANIAFKANRASLTPPEAPSLARLGSMKAAKGAMAGSRPRSTSSPQTHKDTYPDQANAAANALNAATVAHRPTARSATIQGGASPYVSMNRQMFTSHPPVKPEVEEQKRADVLHASAVAMAKRMYNQQQKMIDSTKLAHARSSSFSRHGEHSPRTSGESSDELPRPMSFNNLQEAAYRLAQERLAKLHDEHNTTHDFKDYYGASPQSPQRGKFGTVRSKLTRRRASSDGEAMDDEARSHQIRKQMSMFNTRLTEVDEKKRSRDREALLAAAQRNVKARLQGMDQKMYEETGRIAPGKLSEWESKAQAAARTRVDAQQVSNAGKVDIGGGKLMDREEVERIAAKRVQPLLDEINEKAQAERERQAALRLEEEKRKEDEERRKAREKEIQEIHKKLKDQQKDDEKARRAEVREEQRVRKDEEKATKAEQKRLAKDEKSRPRELETSKSAGKLPETSQQEAQPATISTSRSSGIAFPKLALKSRDRDSGSATSPGEKSPSSDGDVTSPSSKMKNWFKSRFSRPRAKSSNAAMEGGAPKKGFIGGVALTKMRDHNASMSSIDNRSASMRDVALAGRRPLSNAALDTEVPDKEFGEFGNVGTSRSRVREPSVASTVSSRSTGGDKFLEARSEIASSISPPRVIQDPASGRGSPVRESRFSENLE